jgi:hypothetical protein
MTFHSQPTFVSKFSTILLIWVESPYPLFSITNSTGNSQTEQYLKPHENLLRRWCTFSSKYCRNFPFFFSLLQSIPSATPSCMRNHANNFKFEYQMKTLWSRFSKTISFFLAIENKRCKGIFLLVNTLNCGASVRYIRPI